MKLNQPKWTWRKSQESETFKRKLICSLSKWRCSQMSSAPYSEFKVTSIWSQSYQWHRVKWESQMQLWFWWATRIWRLRITHNSKPSSKIKRTSFLHQAATKIKSIWNLHYSLVMMKILDSLHCKARTLVFKTTNILSLSSN